MKKVIKKNALLWTMQRIRKRIPAIISITILSMLSAYLSVKFALQTRMVIDSAISGNMAEFKLSAMMLSILILVTVLIGLLSSHLSDKVNIDLDCDMKKIIMRTILKGDYQTISAYHSGDLVHRLNADISTVNQSIMSIATSLSSFVVRMIAVIIVLSGVSYRFTVALLCVSFFLGGGTLIFQRMLKKLQKQINDASGQISSFLQEVIERLLIVQALDVGDAMEKKADILLEERRKMQRKRKNLTLLSMAGMNVFGQFIAFVTLIWCANQLLQGKMSFGTLTATTQLASQMQAPIIMVPHLLREFMAMTTSAERLIEIEAIPQEEKQETLDISAIYEEMQIIYAENLCFAYSRERVLDEVSFEIPKGGLTVIVGQSGSGKSTLLRLLLSVFIPSKGTLGIAMRNGSRMSLSRDTRRIFTYAPQGNLLLSGTLRENIIFARPDATEEEIQQAIYISAIDDYLPQLPEGLDTYLGENGGGLSEGQAQRVALARAVLSKAPILLLDEVTSALDGETERKVLERIRALKDRTCIVVTHRPAVLEIADLTLSIVDGRIVKY